MVIVFLFLLNVRQVAEIGSTASAWMKLDIRKNIIKYHNFLKKHSNIFCLISKYTESIEAILDTG